jgi:hypothetical protein
MAKGHFGYLKALLRVGRGNASSLPKRHFNAIVPLPLKYYSLYTSLAFPFAPKKTPIYLLDLVIISIFAHVKKTPSQVLGMT